MEKDKEITEVVFRKYKSGFSKGDILALFPNNVHNGHLIDCYEFCGQHGSADYTHCLGITKPASESEYKDLKNHLEKHFGYNLKVIKRRNYQRR